LIVVSTAITVAYKRVAATRLQMLSRSRLSKPLGLCTNWVSDAH
jgi:hypothetical protein